ncbi:MAG: hypothetical protein IH787_06675 [Nitrospirae bacterium]|nr:hypothetical protein [Nitrospirota bacterium]
MLRLELEKMLLLPYNPRQILTIQLDTKEVKESSDLLRILRKQGYEELPLDELQDRLSKIRTALGEFIVSRRW